MLFWTEGLTSVCPEDLLALDFCSSCLPPDCSSSCQRCVEDLQTGAGSVCLWCNAPGMWLLGDGCVPDCPRGRYGWLGACLSKNLLLCFAGIWW